MKSPHDRASLAPLHVTRLCAWLVCGALAGCSDETATPAPDASTPTDIASTVDATKPIDTAPPPDAAQSPDIVAIDRSAPDASSIDVAPPPDVVPVDAPTPRRRKVLLIGLDGVRYDTLQRAAAPSIRALAARGFLSRTWLYVQPMAPTMSGPGWSTIATGVWPDKHRVRGNDFAGHELARYPDFLTRIERIAPRLSTYSIADWPPINVSTAAGPVIGSEVDLRVNYNGDATAGGWVATDARITREAVDRLRTQDPDVTFVYLGNPDVVAHNSGAGAAYLSSIETSDAQVGELVAAVEARPTYAQEDWLIVVTTDHGHVDAGGHGGFTWQERQSFIVAAGGAIPRGPLPFQPRLVDIVPTVFAHLGLTVDPAWGFDGVPLGTPTSDPFDTLASRLRAAVDEAGIPATTLGWTHDTPAAWSIENDRLTAGGVTEWRGWSFVDEAFWVAAEPGQGREGFVRSRGVFAVADSDEWDDIGTPSRNGPYDTTLASAPFTVSGLTSVRLRFSSLYRQEGMQQADVTVSFDGAAQRTVLHYGPNAADANAGVDVISRVESVDIPVPAGARAMVVRWRLREARNNWYWAIDDPSVR